jgi:branched-subunit amino acid ABC-type transport system permease component
MDRRVRAALVAGGAVVASLLLTQVIFPRGTPTAILFAGFVAGLLNGLLAVGMVLIYRSHRIINFAQAALGAGGAIFAYNLVVFLEWPYLLAFVAAIIVSVMIAMAIELAFVRRFFDAPRLVLTVVTIAVIPAIGFMSGQLANLPIFGDAQDRSIDEIAGREIRLPFEDWDGFQLGGFR